MGAGFVMSIVTVPALAWSEGLANLSAEGSALRGSFSPAGGAGGGWSGRCCKDGGPMATPATGSSPPRAGRALLGERFAPEVIDLPQGRARIRLEVRNGEAWDARLEGDEIRLEPAREETQ